MVAAVAGEPGVLGFFKYYEFFVSRRQQRADRVWAWSRRSRSCEIVLPGRDLLLHVHGHQLRGRHPPRATRAGDARRVRRVPVVLPAPRGRAPSCAAAEFLPQFARGPRPPQVDARAAFYLIAPGLFKKVVIASYLARHIVDPVFGAPGHTPRSRSWSASYAYAMQIYADFSGYTDIAIGIALLLGFRFPQNFDRPYARSSDPGLLASMAHDAVALAARLRVHPARGEPRGGSRASYGNLMVTMLLGGLWHGASWTFVVWGALHGIGLCVEPFRRDRGLAAETPGGLAPGGSGILVFLLVCLGWIFFRADSSRRRLS